MPNYSGSWNLVQQMQAVAASNWPIQPGTVGIFALGLAPSASTTRDKYTFSVCVNASATAASNASTYQSAAGTASVGIFALGYVCSVASSIRNKYTYSGDTNGSATAASTALYFGSATGNSTVGIFAIGHTACSIVTTRDKYTYSGCVVSSGAAASAASALGSAASNGTTGVNV